MQCPGRSAAALSCHQRQIPLSLSRFPFFSFWLPPLLNLTPHKTRHRDREAKIPLTPVHLARGRARGASGRRTAAVHRARERTRHEAEGGTNQSRKASIRLPPSLRNERPRPRSLPLPFVLPPPHSCVSLKLSLRSHLVLGAGTGTGTKGGAIFLGREGAAATAPVSRSAMALLVPLVRVALLLLVALPFCAAHPGPARTGGFTAPHRHFQTPALHSDGFGLLARRSIAEAPTDINVTTNSSFVLAADRTYRKDPLNDFRKYPGGWNISEVHYFASVGYTAIPLFAIALVWFVIFFLVMLGICCRHCCCPHHTYKYSRTAYALSLILLILFTCAAIAGCAMLYDGQGKFHKSTTTTLKFVVSQANYTVDNLRNLSDSLSAAKRIDIANSFLLPPNVQTQINDIQGKLNSSATDLAIKTTDNAAKIKKVLNRVRLALVVIAAVMLLLAFVGFLLSIFGLEFLVSVLVVIGWILVTGTFILCGVFLLLHNVVSDTCVAMEEWVAHPTEHTALDEVIPCVEPATANESLYRSRQVTYELVNVVNQVITNVSNRNFPPQLTPFYYNQSGPLMPLLCNPFTPDLRDRNCTRGEVTLDNATQVWKNYECQSKTVSGAEICATVGRVTPSIYGQMAAGVNVSQGLYQYGPFLIQLEDCTFVRDTFTTINQDYCPGLERYSKWVYVGLVMVSSAVMLSLIFWVIYARERRHRVYSKQHQPYPAEDKPAPMAPSA